MKTYGKVVRDKELRAWVIKCEAHVMMKLKRVFEKGPKAAGTAFAISDTPENGRELVWFLQRYPMEVEDLIYLKARELQHRQLDGDIARILATDYVPRDIGLATQPRGYQMVAGDLAYRVGGLILGDDVGVGKTCSAICLLARADVRPALVVTLTSLPLQWRNELKKFAPGLAVQIIKSGKPYDLTVERKKRLPFPDVIIVNYHKLHGWAEALAGKVKTVVFDEVQELRIAEAGGKVSLKYAAAAHVAAHATWRLGLSATPVYNYAGEVFSILQVLKPGALGSKEEFKREWCAGAGDSLAAAQEPDDPKKMKVKNPKALGAFLRAEGLMLRRTRKDVGRELPPLTVVPYEIQADLDQIATIASSASALARAILQQGGLTSTERMRAAEELSWRLRQATGISKAPLVAEFVRMIVETGEKVVLFGWHHEVYEIWREKLQDLGVVFYTGRETQTQKEAAKASFIAGEARVFIMSLRAGAGVDGLQGCCRIVVNGELDWSPAVHEQNTGRVHRDQQKDPVTVYYMISDCGSDPVVSDVLGVKAIQSDGLRDPNAKAGDLTAQTDEHRVKRLAEDFLRQLDERKRGRRAAPRPPEQRSIGGIQ